MQVEDIFSHWAAQAREQLLRIPYVMSLLPATAHANANTQRPTDNWLGTRLQYIQMSPWMAIWPLVLLLILFYLTRENDQPIRYRVPSPRTPEKKELLSNPSIKVCARLRYISKDVAV